MQETYLSKINLVKIKQLLANSQASKSAVATLVAVDIFVIFFAVYEKWHFTDVIVLFWWQNIFIGLVTCYKFIFSKNILFVEKDPSIPAIGKGLITGVFAYKFFIIHLFYLLPLSSYFDINVFKKLSLIALPLGLFILNYLISLIINYRSETSVQITSKEVSDKAILQIFPLHLWIVMIPIIAIFAGIIFLIAGFLGLVDLASINDIFLGTLPTIALVFFMILKTFFEVIAHFAIHSRKENDMIS